MAKTGDMVRFLNTTGGGRITRIEGRLAYVEEDGFETPVLLSDIVVVLPAGHEPKNKNVSKMFDQEAFDAGKKSTRQNPRQESSEKTTQVKEEPLPVVETERGNKLNIVLGFEPRDIKDLSKTRISAVLVNDSNYFLSFTLSVRNDEANAWETLYQGEVSPNELIDLAAFTQQTISRMERIVFQAIAYKKGKTFEIKEPVNVSRKLDITKFFKVHCFRPGVYFDTPVLEIPLYHER